MPASRPSEWNVSFSSAPCFSNVQLVNASVYSPTQLMRGSAHDFRRPAFAPTPAQNPRSFSSGSAAFSCSSKRDWSATRSSAFSSATISFTSDAAAFAGSGATSTTFCRRLHGRLCSERAGDGEREDEDMRQFHHGERLFSF